MNRIPPLPTEQTYAKAAQALDAEFDEEESLKVAITKGLNRLPFAEREVRQYMGRANRLGKKLDAYHHATELSYGGHATVGAFVRGAGAGLLLAARVHEGAVTAGDMQSVFGDQVGHYATIIDLGRQGIGMVGLTTGMIVNRWERQVAPDDEQGLMFRRGLGLATMVAHQIHEGRHSVEGLRQLAERVDGDFDWDRDWQETDKPSLS